MPDLIYLAMIDTPEEKRDFVLVYEKYKFLMLKIARDVLNDDYLAEDAVHEAFIKVAHNMKHIHGIDSVYTKRYLITITKNTAIDIYRSRKVRMKKEMYIDELKENTTSVTYIETDIDNQVLDVLKNLPVKYRDIFILKYSSHMSNSEISKIMDIPEGTIRQRIARGKVIIKDELERLEKK